jgi:hypothetical protein
VEAGSSPSQVDGPDVVMSNGGAARALAVEARKWRCGACAVSRSVNIKRGRTCRCMSLAQSRRMRGCLALLLAQPCMRMCCNPVWARRFGFTGAVFE